MNDSDKKEILAAIATLTKDVNACLDSLETRLMRVEGKVDAMDARQIRIEKMVEWIANTRPLVERRGAASRSSALGSGTPE